MGTLLVDDKDNIIFESEGIKTPIETYEESKPPFAHQLPTLDEPEPAQQEENVKPTQENETVKKDKSNNTVIIMLVVALVIAIGVMIFNNLQDTKEGGE